MALTPMLMMWSFGAFAKRTKELTGRLLPSVGIWIGLHYSIGTGHQEATKITKATTDTDMISHMLRFRAFAKSTDWPFLIIRRNRNRVPLGLATKKPTVPISPQSLSSPELSTISHSLGLGDGSGNTLGSLGLSPGTASDASAFDGIVTVQLIQAPYKKKPVVTKAMEAKQIIPTASIAL